MCKIIFTFNIKSSYSTMFLLPPNPQETFEFKYQGDNYVDINTLLTSQFHFIAALSEIQRELYPDADIKFKVGAFKEGSFIVQLIAETSFLQQIFTKDTVDVIGGVLGAFASIVTLAEFVKGKKPELIAEENEVVILGDAKKNAITINKNVYNIYRHNTTLSQSIQKNFEVLENDASIEGIEIRQDNQPQPIISIPQERFDDLARPNPYLDREQSDETLRDQIVFIKKPNLYPEAKKNWTWELLHRGRDIKAKIIDKDFEKQINGGLRVAQGDRLLVDLKIGSVWDDRVQTFIENGKFEILKVHKLIPRNEQANLFNEDGNAAPAP